MRQRVKPGCRLFAVGALLTGLFALGCKNPTSPDPTPVEYPAIQLRQDSLSLPNGAGEYTFNEAVLVDGDGGYCCENVIFAVENQGQEWLNISRVVLSSGNIGDFDLDISGLFNMVAPSSYTNFSLRFDPIVNLGSRSAVVTIISDDQDNGIYTFKVKGSGMKKCFAGDGAANFYFGTSGAISGNTMVVGAYYDYNGAFGEQGAAYVFERDRPVPDHWGEIRKLVASDGTDWNRFGWSVAIDGDTIVVGARGVKNNQGAVYIFYRNHGGADRWGEVKKLTAGDSSNNDNFGYSVAVSGDTIVVGANGVDDTFGDQGAAYVYYRNHGGAGNWGEVTRITAGDAALLDGFGCSVAIAGDIVAVAAAYDDADYNNQGSVYIYDRSHGGTDNWGEVKRITASNAGEYHLFGLSVAIEGDLLLAGKNDGSAYLFDRNFGGADNWAQIKELSGSDTVQYDFFGRSVAISGDTIAVGALWDDIDSNRDQGSVYLFYRNAGGAGNWGEVKKLTAGDGAENDSFGSFVAVAGNTVVIGANDDDIGTNGDQGSAYMFQQ